MRIYLFSLFFLFITSLTSLSCGGCGDPCEGIECSDGLVCVVGTFAPVCVDPALACQPACESTQRCNAEKVCEDVPIQCSKAKEVCDPRFAVNDGFLCIDSDGAGIAPPSCLPFCNKDGTCDNGALCFLVNSQNDSQCSTDSDCNNGKTCNQGICRDRVCRPSECEGFIEGQKTCEDLNKENAAFPKGAQCIETTNNASFCFPAGPKKVGEACEGLDVAIRANNFAKTCEPLALCANNTCQRACKNNEHCSKEESCILADEGELGFCGKECVPFKTKACDEGFTCLPVGKEKGLCVKSGDKKSFESCEPGKSECGADLLCIPYGQDAGRCQPLCDLSAGASNEDGTLGQLAQSQRDASCPQSATKGAFIRFHNIAELTTGVDIYVGDTMTPTFSNLQFGKSVDMYKEFSPGQYTVKVLPMGSPHTDPPLIIKSFAFKMTEITDFYILPVNQTPDKVELLGYLAEDEVAPSTGNAKVRIQHHLVDVDKVDVVLLPKGEELLTSQNKIELVSDFILSQRSDFYELPEGEYETLVFRSGDIKTDLNVIARSNVMLQKEFYTLLLRGTAAPDDQPLAGLTIFSGHVLPSTRGQGLVFTCMTLRNDAFGYCQQDCFEDGSGFSSGVCEGEKMGCAPVFLDANRQWKNLCGPVGSLPLDAPCEPFPRKTWNACEEGLYCLEYGNSAAGFNAAKRGKCQPLCIDGDSGNAKLKCAQDQQCQPLAYHDTYKIGKCGFDCTTNNKYEDQGCPSGLQSCKPIASQVPALNGGPAEVENEQPFCSAAGNLAAGERCAGSDCVPGTECLFPRSAGKTDFSSSIASQYFGGPGLQATCTLQCDPFDHNSSVTKCGVGETCLFNFPWSAEVGHCAEIKTKVNPMAACLNPGEACGEDAICVAFGTSNTCFQFCQYEGSVGGTLQPSGCSTGLLCTPFINDIGICLAPSN